MSISREEEIWRLLAEPFPQELLETKPNSSNMYIAAEHVRMRLIEATGNRFDFAIQSVEYRNDGAIRDRTDKNSGEIVGTPVCVVTGSLTIPGLGSRTDVGVQEIQAGSGADAAYKGAVSDCLKRCAMNFGVGLRQLYIEGGKPPKAAPAPRRQATSRPHPIDGNTTIEPSPLGPTDDEFAALARKYIAAKDSIEFAKLPESAGKSSVRWMALISATNTTQGMEWLARKMEAKGITDAAVLDALKIRTAELDGTA